MLVGLAVLLVALGYFAFMAFKSATVYYYTVGELQELGPTQDGKLVRVSGTLVSGTFKRDTESTLARFSLTDGALALSAVHDGVLPELFFNEHSEIILEGSYTPDGVFQSYNVIVKCPSKYIAG
jgi:cytochrome c-type biogenesis protein CcmE